jgi:hypothetical protein
MPYDTWSADDAQCSVIRENMRPAQASINVTMPYELYDWVRAYADDLGVSMSAVVRSVLMAQRVDIDNESE